jgi:hypothetical protein
LNDEGRNPKEIRSPNVERGAGVRQAVFGHSDFAIPSDLVIRHSDLKTWFPESLVASDAAAGRRYALRSRLTARRRKPPRKGLNPASGGT